MSRRAQNQYIELVRTKPELIIPCERGDPAEPARNSIEARAKKFSRVVCELGSGSGGHLIEQAAQAPDTLFVGFELRFKRAFRTAEKAEERGLSNLLVMRTDALRLPELFAAESLDGVFVNFPDPWDKPRWEKHRLLTPAFIENIAKLLKPGGFFRYKTDHAAYFEQTVAGFSKYPLLQITILTRDLYLDGPPAGNIASEFEGLFKSKGLPVHMLEAKRIGRS